MTARKSPLNKNVVLGILVLATMMVGVDSTVVLLAFPTIVNELNSNFLSIIWVILAYLLIVTVCTTQLGRIGDIFGRARIFNFGFIIFTASSFACGLALSDTFLIGSRVFQAIGGAMMTANSGAIIADTFEPKERGHAFGFTAMGWNVGAMLGIVIGGVITTFLGWRYIFFINVPIGIVAFFYGLKYIRDNPIIKSGMDIPGMLTFGAAVFLLSYSAINSIATSLSISDVVMMLMGAALLPAFVLWELKTHSPMLDLRQFKNRILRSSILAALFQSLGYLAIAFLIIMYMQGIRGLSPLDAALVLVPGYILSGLLAPFMGGLADRYGARNIATAGIALMCVAILLYLNLSATLSYYISLILAASIVSGIGSAMFFPSNNRAVMANAQPGAYGATNGLLRTMSSLGIMFSFVLVISVAAHSIPKSTAFEIFVGTSTLIGKVSAEFMSGIYVALYVALVILAIAGILSFTRGRDIEGGK